MTVADLVYRSALALDDRNFAAYLELCDPQFEYVVTAYSPELRKDMTWLSVDKPALAALFETLPRHNSDRTPLSRHVTVYLVEGTSVVSGLQVFRTALDGGVTELYAVGKIFDSVRITDDNPRLLKRHIRLDTRMLGIGTHIPF
jgi:methanesulfonate monooxygenase subunit beta